MDSNKVSKIQFSSGVSGSSLLQTETVQFIFSGTITGGHRIDNKTVLIPNGQKYFSDALFSISGSINSAARPWKHAPRSYYFLSEPSSPTPRVYLSKSNYSDRVEIYAFITNNTSSNFTLSGSYIVSVEIFIFGSSIMY